MTTAQLDHLRKIDAHCADLLDIGGASKDAEAGWKATRAAIEWLTAGPLYSNEGLDMLEIILAAFPLESLEA